MHCISSPHVAFPPGCTEPGFRVRAASPHPADFSQHKLPTNGIARAREKSQFVTRTAAESLVHYSKSNLTHRCCLCRIEALRPGSSKEASWRTEIFSRNRDTSPAGKPAPATVPFANDKRTTDRWARDATCCQ